MDFMIGSRAQHIVLTKVLGVKKIYAVIGFSMGAQQVSSLWFGHSSRTERCVRRIIGPLCTQILLTGMF